MCSGTEVSTMDIDKTASIDCKGQQLDCSKLQTLRFGSRHLQRLVIRKCVIKSSIECALATLNATGVNALELYNTPISAQITQGLDMINTLIIDNGSLSQVPVDMMKELPNLQMLRLINNHVSLPPNTFEKPGVPRLLYLEVSRNSLKKTQPDVFEGLTSLETLQFSNNNIETIDENTFRGLNSLSYLGLNGNRIRLVPAGLFQLPSLQTLEMQGSSVRALPADLFRSTTALVDLDLAGNQLRSLPETVFDGLQNLERLHLEGNKLQAVTKRMFEQLENITEIYLNGNLIDFLPEHLFSGLSHLRIVSLADNNIQDIHPLTFHSASIVTLDLSHNQLDWNCLQNTIKMASYEGGFRFQSPLYMLKILHTLDLSHNHISSVCSDWRDELRALRVFDLSYNNLTTLSAADVNFLSAKITVDLRDNQIATIEKSESQPTTTLLLGRNPFHCDCHLYQFLSKLEHLPYNVNDAKCELPLSLKHQTLSSIATGRTNSSLSLNDLTCPLSDTPDGCECIVRPAMSRTECSCHDLRNKTLPEPTNNGPGTEMRLTLQTQQHLEDIPPFVTELGLSGLGLETVPGFPESVRRADLSHNRLSRVPLELLRRNITLQLRGNRLKCDCWSQEDVGHLKDNLLKIDDLKSVQCADGGRLEDVDVPRLCYVFNATVIGVSLASLGVVLAVASIALYKYSLEIKVYLYNRGWSWLVKEDMLDADKEYDIFLSYVHRDVDLVKNSIQAVLDKEYKVCVHDRDWIVGDRIEDQIYRSVAQSRRTLIVLSNAFMESNSWALAEFEAAHAQSVVDKLPRAVVILLEDVDVDNAPDHIKRHMQTNTYIKWGDGMFWERLRYALPRKMKAKDLRRQRAAAQAAKNLAIGGFRGMKQGKEFDLEM